MPVICQTEGNMMMHHKRNLDVPSSVSKQDGVSQKRPHSFYSSNIKTWVSRHSGHGGNPDGSGKSQAGVGKRDVIGDSPKQGGGEGLHNVNGFSVVIDCEIVSGKSSLCVEKCPSVSTEGAADCDVVICDSDDDLNDSQRVQGPQKTIKAKFNIRSKSAKYRAKVRKQKALSPRAKVASKTTSVKGRSLNPVDLVLEVDSDDGDSDDGDSEDGEVESFVDVTPPSMESLNNNVDISSCQTSASGSSQVHSPVIEIDSDSCSSFRERAPSQTKSCASVRERASLQTKPGSTVRERAPSQTKSCSSVRERARSQKKSRSSVRVGDPSETNVLQYHSVSLNIENEHFNDTPTPPLSTTSQRKPHDGEGFIGFPKVHAAPAHQYSNYLGAFQSYCESDGTPGISHLSNEGAQSSLSDARYANGSMGADSFSQEQLLAFVKSGKFSLQYIAGIPVLCPINSPSTFLPNLVAMPFGGSGLQPNMNMIGSIYSPTSLQTNSVGYGTVRGTVPGSNSVGYDTGRETVPGSNAVEYGTVRGTVPGTFSTAFQTNAFGRGARRMSLTPMNGKSSQSSQFDARNGCQTMPKANADMVKVTKRRKRARKSTDSPIRRARVKATTSDVSADKNKDLGDKIKGENDNTGVDNKDKPMKDTAEKVKKDSERPVAKALMGLAMQLVSKQVIVGLIKVTKKSLEKRPEEERILTKLQNRHVELKRETEAFELKTKLCNCRRFKTESSNVALEHVRHGSSVRIYRCCFCLSVTTAYRTFRQHMKRVHKIVSCRKHDTDRTISCPFCPYDTTHRPLFELHSRRCCSLLQKENNLHPRLDDFDIPITYQEKESRQVARELSLVASIGSKINQHGQQNSNLGVWCHACAKSYINSFALRRHINKMHKIPDLEAGSPPPKQKKISNHKISHQKSGSTPLNQRTPSNHKISDQKSGNTPLNQRTPSNHKIPDSKSDGTPKKETTSSKTTSKLSTGICPPKGVKAVKCCLCEELLGRDMIQHFRAQHHISLSTMVKKHFCYFCDCALENVQCFEEHMVTSHDNIFPDVTGLWLRISATVKLRERDAFIVYDALESDGAPIGQPWKCLRCNERFHSSSFCYRHAMLLHAATKVECQLCPKMIATGATYTQHLQQCHIRKCCVLIERLAALPYVATSTPKTKPAQLPCLLDCDSKIDVELSEEVVSATEIESPSITSCDQDFPTVGERDSVLEPVTVGV